jgi:hypothetical protein
LYIISNTEREREEEEEEEEEEKRFLIAIRSSHQAHSQSTNQIKGNYRKEKIERKRKKEKEDASLRNPAIDFCFVFDTYC